MTKKFGVISFILGAIALLTLFPGSLFLMKFIHVNLLAIYLPIILVPICLIGIALGIISIKKEDTKIWSILGIILNAVGLLIVCFLLYTLSKVNFDIIA